MPSDTVVGAVLKTIPIDMSSGKVVTGCPANTVLRKAASRSTVSGQSNVYDTGIAGVGYRLSDSSTIYTNPAASNTLSGSGDFQWNGGSLTLTLIKTGAISPGSFPAVEYGRISYNDVTPFLFTVRSGGKVSLPTCSMSGPGTVNLGNVAASMFTGVGTTSAKVSAKLGFANCDSSLAGVTFALSGTADTDNVALFALSTASTAKGIAIELLDAGGNGVVPKGAVKWDTATTNAQSNGYTFQVRYKQTRPSVTPGTANGAITVNAVYR